jgi:hypothetical protein
MSAGWSRTPTRAAGWPSRPPLPCPRPATSTSRSAPARPQPKGRWSPKARKATASKPTRRSRSSAMAARGTTEDCPPLRPFFIEFNNPIEAESYQESMLRVEPEIPGVTVNVNGNTITFTGQPWAAPPTGSPSAARSRTFSGKRSAGPAACPSRSARRNPS